MITVARSEIGHLMACYLREARHEFLRLLRTPSFVLPTLLFPALFYVLFGVVLAGSRGGVQVSGYLLASYGVFGIMGASLFGFGVTIAIERERGFLTLKRAQPMPPGAFLFAKLVMAMLFAAIISVLLALLATTLAGVRLAPQQWILLFLINVSGTLPFCALGLWLGSLVSGSAAPAVVNLIYLPMSFLSGLWMPLSVLPDFIARFAPMWPSYHLGQIALGVVGHADSGNVLAHVGFLVAMSALCLFLARGRLDRESDGSGR
ncbi:ABC transporter permease [Dokdonella sp.]|uniref:ABC transporter permease n=1 Tax=Dokdonella sp. TaxID=2291710 RepID=UPI0035274264